MSIFFYQSTMSANLRVESQSLKARLLKLKVEAKQVCFISICWYFLVAWISEFKVLINIHNVFNNYFCDSKGQELGDSLSAIDFEQMEIQNLKFLRIMEDKNAEVSRLKRESSLAIQVVINVIHFLILSLIYINYKSRINVITYSFN